MEELSYVLTRDFVSCFHVFFSFSLPLNFILLAASISHFLTAAMKFSCFSSIEIRLLCFRSLALALPGFHVSVNIKNNVEKDTTLFFFSLSLKVRAAMRFPSIPVYIGVPVVRMDRRSGGRKVA